MIRDVLKELATTQSNIQESGIGDVGTNEERLLLLLKQDRTLTAKLLAIKLNLTQRQVERMIARLKKEGLLLRHGASTNGYWEVTEKAA